MIHIINTTQVSVTASVERHHVGAHLFGERLVVALTTSKDAVHDDADDQQEREHAHTDADVQRCAVRVG